MQITAAVVRDRQTAPTLEPLEMRGPKDDEVLVRMVATGICHTDLKYAGSTSPLPKPVVLGHEGAGIVEAVGASVRKVAKGDHVVLTFGSCGACPSCRDAEPAYCYDLAALNFGSGRTGPAAMPMPPASRSMAISSTSRPSPLMPWRRSAAS